uniref:ORF1 n=1 Tax=Torque teno Leptonychotes weddellii virus-1 TaxID=2012676 RepID=A0A1Z2RVE1_9VIRU|nr:ORF1 [Torque teno Leptonychotes weddellii virus 1]
MVFRRRRYRRPRRSRWRGKRRTRYWWRKYHRGHRRWRRRGLYPRQRTATVRYYPSRRRKRISVRGWEPLGNVCPSDSARTEATPYLDLDKDSVDIFSENSGSGSNGASWHGQWGHHFFTFYSLLIRAKYYFNYWSSDWEGYDYLQFLGGYLWLPRMPSFSWMFYLDSSIQSNPKDQSIPENKYKYDKSWVHPGILLNRPGSRILLSTLQSRGRSLFRKMKVRPPAGWEGTYRMDAAQDYLLFHWSWTTVNLTSSFYDFYCQRKRDPSKTTSQCIANPWFMGEKETFEAVQNRSQDNEAKKYSKQLQENLNKWKVDSRAAWVNRALYIKSDCSSATGQDDKLPGNFHNWGPFLPQNVLFDLSFGNSVYFRYKLYFKVSGDSLYRRLPSVRCKDNVIPPCPGFTDNNWPEIPNRSILRKRKLPTIYDILPGDLDETGNLTERAYERITGPNRYNEPTRMGDVPHREPPRKRDRIREPEGQKAKASQGAHKKKMERRREPGGGGPPPHPPPVTEPLDLLLNFPK